MSGVSHSTKYYHLQSLSSLLPPSGCTGFRNPNHSRHHRPPRSTCTDPEPRARRYIRRALLNWPHRGLRCHVHSFRPPPCAFSFSCLVVMPRLDELFASSRPLFLHDKVHTLLHHLPRILFSHMVFLLHITCFHFLTPKHRSARLSILFIVIRITPSHYTGGRRALYFLGWSFGVTWGILVAQMFWVCEKKTTWKVRHFVIFNRRHLMRLSQLAPAPQCPVGVPVAIAQLISTVPLRSQFLHFLTGDCRRHPC